MASSTGTTRLGLTHGAGHFDPTKSGMSSVSKAEVGRVVEEMSRGSKYYANAQKRDGQLETRLVLLKGQLGQTSSSELRAYEEAMSADAARAEAHERDLSQVWVVLDMDAFYASVEIRDQPDLARVPMAVGGLGMITTANYLARKFGVRAAMPGFIAKRLCPALVFVPPHFEKYTAAAEDVRSVLRKYDPDFSAMSLDEAYLCLTPYLQREGLLAAAGGGQGGEEEEEEGAGRASAPPVSAKRRRVQQSPSHSEDALPHPPTPSELTVIGDLVASIRAEVTAATRGLTCSCGVAANPMLAKIASNDKKPDGQAIIPWARGAIIQYMSALPVRTIPGVGKVTERLLTEMGLTTCADVLKQKGRLRAAFNERMSSWLLRCALGIASADREEAGGGGDDTAVSRKSISMERTFGDCGEWETLRAKAADLAHGVSKDMAEEGILGTTATLKMKLHTFEVVQRSATLARPTADATLLQDAAVALLKAAWPVRLRLLGFRMSGLSRPVTKPTALQAFLVRPPGPPATSSSSDDTDGRRGGGGTGQDDVERARGVSGGGAQSASSSASCGGAPPPRDGASSSIEVLDFDEEGGGGGAQGVCVGHGHGGEDEGRDADALRELSLRLMPQSHEGGVEEGEHMDVIDLLDDDEEEELIDLTLSQPARAEGHGGAGAPPRGGGGGGGGGGMDAFVVRGTGPPRAGGGNAGGARRS